jgi:branched-chain amino acid transport system substrate-binding protein
VVTNGIREGYEVADLYVGPMPARRLRLAGPALALLLASPLACTDDDASSPTIITASSTTPTTEPARIDDGMLTIGLLLPMSGEGASIGQGMADAAAQAVDEIKHAGGILGQPVRLVPADEGADPSSATDAINTLLDAGVDTVVGPASSTVALATLDDLMAAGVLTCSPTATSLALDEFPSSDLFFRTAPSDSLQADAIAELAQQTGRSRAAVVFLDDRYGHPMAEAVADALSAHALDVVAEIPFASTDESLIDEATELADNEAEVVVVLGDGDHTLLMLKAIGETMGRFPDVDPPDIIVNDAVRRPPSPQMVEQLPNTIRERVQGVSPVALPQSEDEPPGPFATNAYDCVNLIALSAVQAGTDDPAEIAARMTDASSDGQPCRDFETCVGLLRDARNIDYEGPGGQVQIGSEGDPERAWFDVFEFDEDGRDVSTTQMLAP